VCTAEQCCEPFRRTHRSRDPYCVVRIWSAPRVANLVNIELLEAFVAVSASFSIMAPCKLFLGLHLQEFTLDLATVAELRSYIKNNLRLQGGTMWRFGHIVSSDSNSSVRYGDDFIYSHYELIGKKMCLLFLQVGFSYQLRLLQTLGTFVWEIGLGSYASGPRAGSLSDVNVCV
jgi:hypothetical protein